VPARPRDRTRPHFTALLHRKEWAAFAFAAYTRGAIVVPMYESQKPADWQYIVENAGIRFLCVSDKAMDAALPWLAEGRVDRVVALDGLGSHPPRANLVDLTTADLSALPHPPTPDVGVDEPCQIIFTSGTTGKVGPFPSPRRAPAVAKLGWGARSPRACCCPTATL
jgi:long-subunit acyl-CoA synthetase (AMP-forming)